MEMKKLLDYLSEWSYWATLEEFNIIFGHHIGEHLFREYVNLRYGFFKFWRYLDDLNKFKLALYLEQKRVQTNINNP